MSDSTERRAQSTAPDGGYKWRVLSTVIFGIFMVILDTTVVNVAFQTLRQDFGASLGDSQWIISVYVLALGISTPLAGFLADRLGIKKVYLGGLAIFAAGSLLCGVAPNLTWLVAARGIQGFGGGIALPLGVALLMDAFPAEEQGLALGFFGIAAIVAPAVGPILGGWLVDHNLWRLIFFINPPIGLIGVILGTRFLREQRSDRRPPLDVLGLITEIIGFGAILYGASIAADRGWASPDVLISFGVGAAGLLAFGVIELYVAKAPLLDLRLFKNRVFLNASLLGYVSTWALFGAEFLLPVYLQALRGRTALETGLILLPMAITGGVSVTLAGRLYDRLGPRPLVAVGFGILIVNTWQLAQLQANTPISWIMFLLALRGLALGLTVQTTMVTALSVVPKRELARGSSLTNATRNVVQSIGVAVLATVLASTLSPQVQDLQKQLQDAPPAQQAAPSPGQGQNGLQAQGASPQGAFGSGPGAAGQSAAPGSASGSAHVGICEPIKVAGLTSSRALANDASGPALASFTPASSTGLQQDGLPQGGLPPGVGALIQEACRENVAGFERAYNVTFYAALLALLLGVLLPGWPLKWAGRRAADMPAAH